MTERWIRMLDHNDEPMFVDWSDRDPKAKLPKGAVEVDRAPAPGEDYTPEGGWHVKDPKALADYGLGWHIEEAHVQKRIEALLIANGVPMAGGLLDAESKMRGIALEEMAAIVSDKAADFFEIEAIRQRSSADNSVAAVSISGPPEG